MVTPTQDVFSHDEFDPDLPNKHQLEFNNSKVIVLLLTQSDYRVDPDYPNLKSVDYDRESMRDCFSESLPGKADKVQIIPIHNAENRRQIDDAIEPVKRYIEGKAADEHLLIFFYYSGHGVMIDSETYMVMGPHNNFYSLASIVKRLTVGENVVVYSFYDCDRTQLTPLPEMDIGQGWKDVA